MQALCSSFLQLHFILRKSYLFCFFILKISFCAHTSQFPGSPVSYVEQIFLSNFRKFNLLTKTKKTTPDNISSIQPIIHIFKENKNPVVYNSMIYLQIYFLLHRLKRLPGEMDAKIMYNGKPGNTMGGGKLNSYFFKF